MESPCQYDKSLQQATTHVQVPFPWNRKAY